MINLFILITPHSLLFQPFSEAKAQANYNSVSKFFAEKIEKVVDKMHYKVNLYHFNE